MRASSAVATLLLSVAGCAFMHDPSRMAGPSRDPMEPIDVRALGDEVCAMRDLPLRHALDVRTLSEDDFAFRFFAVSDGSKRARTDADEAFWKGFGFVPPGVSAREATRVVESGVVGFYDPRTKKLYLRGAHGGGERVMPSRSSDRYVLVHEIEHALQDQNFGLDEGKGLSEDEALAYHALVEGDARLTEIGAHARDVAGDDHWVTHATYWLRTETVDDILLNEGVSGATLREAPALVRRRFMFPYVEGAAFVGDLVRAGGLRLVDQAFAHPPRSTEQVMHPQKYVDGELPVPVDAPVAPEGWGRLAWGTMGELATAVLLAQCEPPKSADLDATGWGGDAWAMVVAGPNEGALLWSTVWDDEASAARFERAAGARGACLQKATVDPRLGREVLVLREGKRVAYVQGLTEALREPTARALLSLPKDAPPAAPPFEHVTIPVLVDPYRSFAHRGEYANGTWTSEPLGMRMRIPAGFQAVDPGVNEASMRDASSGSFAEFHVLFQPATETLRQAIVRQIVSGVREQMLGRLGLLTYTGDDEAEVGGGTAHDYHWQWTLGGRLDIRFFPACGGKGGVVVVTGWNSYSGQVATDRWLGAFHLPDPGSPACTWLRDAPEE